MPGHEVLAQMYGPEYGELFARNENMGGAEDASRVLDWLEREGRGTFIDYGCGAGHLLKEAMRLNWQAIGVEFDAAVAAEVAHRIGAQVVTDPSALGSEPLADVLHLGDVIEHLTDGNRQIPEILGLIKPGGLLLAQGPLEANANLFTLALRLSRLLRPGRRMEIAPYHVLLATAKGQKCLFQRHGLRELEYTLREAAWPAPDKLSRHDLNDLRLVGLFTLRRLSQIVSSFSDKWGNRYFYAGRLDG